MGENSQKSRQKQMMMIRVALAVALIAPIMGCGGSFTFTVPQAKLQESIDDYFPLNTADFSENELPVQATLSEPELLLTEGSDRFALKVKVVTDANVVPASPTSAIEPPKGLTPGPGPSPPFAPKPPPETEIAPKVPPKTLEGTITLSGKISLNAEAGAFYLLDLAIDDVSLDQPSEVPDEPLRDTVEKLLNNYLTENPVYTLSDEDTKTRFAKSVLKSVSVKDGKLTVELGS